MGDDANNLQVAYRQLLLIQRSVAKSNTGTYNDIPAHMKARMNNTYSDHTAILTNHSRDSANAGLINMNTYQIKVKLELAELLKGGERTRTKMRRALRTAATKVLSHKTQVMRKSYAAARPPPQ